MQAARGKQGLLGKNELAVARDAQAVDLAVVVQLQDLPRRDQVPDFDRGLRPVATRTRLARRCMCRSAVAVRCVCLEAGLVVHSEMIMIIIALRKRSLNR